MPGKLLWKLDPGAVDRLAARLPQGSALISATNGKTTTAAMAARILAPSVRLAHNRVGANLVSGVASALARRARRGAGALRGGRGRAAGSGAAASAAGPSRSGTSFATSSTATASWSCWPGAGARWCVSWPPTRALVVNGDDPQLGDLARERPGSTVFGLDDPRHASAELQHAADSKWCVRCGTPYAYAAAYIGHLGDYRCPACGHARPPSTCSRARSSSNGPRKRLVPARDSRGHTPGRAAGARALQRLQRARGGVSGSCARCALGRDSGRFAGLFGGIRPVRANRDRRALAARAADQEPCRCQRGRADAPRRNEAQGAPGGAERRDRRRPRRLLDLGRRLRAASRRARAPGRERRARGRARVALQVRRPARETRSRSCPRSRQRSTAASS